MTALLDGDLRGVSFESFREVIEAQRILFGCARLQHIRGARQRERILHAAIDGGVRRFDVAPAYGAGLGERALGDALRGRSTEVVVNTKAGIPIWIYPSVDDRAFRLLRATELVIGTHRRAYARRDFRPRTLRHSLEESLKRLRMSCVETFFLHEPIAPFSMSEWCDISETMNRLRDAGKLRSWGIAGPTRRYDLDRLPSDASLVIQQPLTELADVPNTRATKRIAFAMFAAFGASQTSAGFGDFVARAAIKHPDTSFIVSTSDVARLMRWMGTRHER